MVLVEYDKLDTFESISYGRIFYIVLIPFYLASYAGCYFLNRWLGQESDIRQALESSAFYDVFKRNDVNISTDVSIDEKA